MELRRRAFAADHLRDPLFVAGTVLYWGEGAKTRKLLAVSNADAAALRLFLAWARAFHDPAAEFVLSLQLHTGNDEAAARRWWSRDPAARRSRLHEDVRQGPRNRAPQDRLVHGVCRIRIRRATDAWHRTLVWIGVVAAALAGRPHD